MFCSKCRNPVNEEDAFCPKCGNSINHDGKHKQIDLMPHSCQNKKSFLTSNKKALGVFLIVASLFMILCAVIDLIQTGGNSPSNAWRGDSSASSPTGPLDFVLIVLGILGIWTSIKLLKGIKKT